MWKALQFSASWLSLHELFLSPLQVNPLTIAGHCTGVCCPHVAKVSIALMLEGPLFPELLELHCVVLKEIQILKNQCRVQRGCISEPRAACWHAQSANSSPSEQRGSPMTLLPSPNLGEVTDMYWAHTC